MCARMLFHADYDKRQNEHEYRQLIKEIIYKALANRDTTGACRRPLESTEKRKVNEY